MSGRNAHCTDRVGASSRTASGQRIVVAGRPGRGRDDHAARDIIPGLEHPRDPPQSVAQCACASKPPWPLMIDPGADDRTPVGTASLRSPVEIALAGLWAEALGRTAPGRDENFFMLGGDSLRGAQLLSKVLAVFGVAIPVEALFDDAGTIAAMARRIEAQRARRAARGARPDDTAARRRSERAAVGDAGPRLVPAPARSGQRRLPRARACGTSTARSTSARCGRRSPRSRFASRCCAPAS